MRVLQVHNRYREPGGEDRLVAEEAALLRSAGHEVEQWIAGNPESDPAAAGALALAGWNPGSAREAARRVTAFEPDVVHVHNTWFRLSPSVLRPMTAKARLVCTVHNYRHACIRADLFRNNRPCEDCVGHVPWRGVLHRCYHDRALVSAATALAISAPRALRTWGRHADRICAVTEFQRSILVRSGLPPEKLIVVPNFARDPGVRQSPPSSSNLILVAGRLAPEKGIGTLLEAWSRARTADLRLVVVGGGPLAAELRSGAPTGVEFAGHKDHDEVLELMRQARAVALPSRAYEGLPLTLLEAMASGTPLVASAHGGMLEVISRTGGQLLATPGDVSDWSRALEQLAAGAKIDEWGGLARAEFERNYQPARALERLLNLYGAAEA